MKSQKLISWKVLDRYKTSRELADLLRRHKIKGLRNACFLCPLALATGWKVNVQYRIRLRDNERVLLTDAEKDFVSEYDSGKYPDLERK